MRLHYMTDLPQGRHRYMHTNNLFPPDMLEWLSRRQPLHQMRLSQIRQDGYYFRRCMLALRLH
jgi:hypothetical protein